MAENTETVTVAAQDRAAVAYKAVEGVLAEIEAQNARLAFDYTTEDGEAKARSHIHSLRGKKGDIERLRKELKADALEYGRQVDGMAKGFTGSVQAMIDLHEKPLKEKAEKEQQRIAYCMESVRNINTLGNPPAGAPLDYLQQRRKELAGIEVDESFCEFMADATREKREGLARLDQLIQAAEEQAAKDAELERLRAAEKKREQEEADARAAKERADREAAIAAQAAAEAEARAKQEAAAAQQALQTFAVSLQPGAGATAASIATLMQAVQGTDTSVFGEYAAKAEQLKQAALPKLLAHHEAAVLREAEQVEAQALRDAEAKRQADAKAKAEADAKRAADVAHRNEIMSAAIGALSHELGIEYAVSRDIVEMIEEGKVPHVTIAF